MGRKDTTSLFFNSKKYLIGARNKIYRIWFYNIKTRVEKKGFALLETDWYDYQEFAKWYKEVNPNGYKIYVVNERTKIINKDTVKFVEKVE